jgi:hypothetical protein
VAPPARGHALAIGLVDVKVAATGNDWSGLRLVWRAASRGPAATAPGDAAVT